MHIGFICPPCLCARVVKVQRKGLYTKIVSGYRVTLPDAARAALDVKVGDFVRIEIYEDRIMIAKAE